MSGDICGETFDHAERMTYEDVEVEQWECTRCGAEWYHDKEDDDATPNDPEA